MEIEEGEITWKKVLREFWKGFELTLEKAKDEMKNLKKQSIPTGVHCRKCADGEYQIKWGKNGQFLACSNYPDCNSTEDFKRTLDGVIHIVEKEFAKDPCPTCGKRFPPSFQPLTVARLPQVRLRSLRAATRPSAR